MLLNDSSLCLDDCINCHYKCWALMIEEIIKKANHTRQLFLCYHRAWPGLFAASITCAHTQHPMETQISETTGDKTIKSKELLLSLFISAYYRSNEHEDLLAVSLPEEKVHMTLSTLMMAFQPWNFSSLWCKEGDLAFVKLLLNLLYSFHFAFFFFFFILWYFGDETTDKLFPSSLLHGTMQMSALLSCTEDKKTQTFPRFSVCFWSISSPTFWGFLTM